MNPQQGVQPRSSANGYGRRRVEKDGGPRLENRAHSGKSRKSANLGSVSGNKVGGPMHDRLVYLSTCLIGQNVEVQVKNGSVYSGIYHATDVDKEFGIILKMARMTKDGSLRPGQKANEDTLSKAFSDTLIIPAKELVQVIAKDVSVTRDGLSNELLSQKPQEILIDSYISQSRHVDLERELEPWVPDEGIPQCPELDNIFDGPWERGWDQFETNEVLFGVKSTFNEDLYTTKLEKGPQMRELEREAARIAREIEGEDTRDLHLAEERGLHLQDNFDVDEETRFSSVYRDRVIDDSGYEEEEDIVLDSLNTETFGVESCSHERPSSGASAGGIGSDRAQGLSSSSSMDDAQTSQANTNAEGYHAGLHHPAGQPSAELNSKSSVASNGESRVQGTISSHPGSTDTEDQTVKEVLAKETHALKSDDSPSLLDSKDGSDAKNLSTSTSFCASHSTLKDREKISSNFDPLEGPLSRKPEETQAEDTNGRPSSSASSASDRPGAVSASSRPGLTPSSSISSLSSEKSTLNPHAKEFKLNPNAKSFIPQAPVRPLSPVSDGSFYFPANMPAMSHMHPVGVGMGPFMGHQPVIFNPQVAQMQSSQAYLHPNGAQYGQQVLYGGHSRQVPYIPSFQPEMPYKGRDY